MRRLIDKAIMAYRDGGLSLIPINNTTKRPYSALLPEKLDHAGQPIPGKYGNQKTWLPYQQRHATDDEVQSWMDRRIQSVAVVCGGISGNLEILDFDNCPGSDFGDLDGEGTYLQWRKEAGSLLDEYSFPVQRTGSGGVQLAWRCDDIQGNQKLAWVGSQKEACGKACMIETRGEGGYAVLPPSIHPNGKRYALLQGRFSDVPVIRPDHRAYLLDLARSLNLWDEPERPERERKVNEFDPPAGSVSNEEVVRLYNEKYDIAGQLLHYGYSDAGHGRFSRPGKPDSAGIQVNTGDNKAYAFSSNDAMTFDRNGAGHNQPFSPFDLFMVYECGNDMKHALRMAAVELGVAFRLHTLLLIDGFDNAELCRDIMFPHGWVVRVLGREVRADGDFDTRIVWGSTKTRAGTIATAIRGHGITLTGTINPQRLAADALLVDYLNAVKADADHEHHNPSHRRS